MIQNAKSFPKRYFGRHMGEGVAEYRPKGKEPYRVLVNEETIRQMDPTFEGRPFYVLHKDEVDLENLEREADGYVIRSFYNPTDGQHWAEFLAVSDEAHQAISKGWKLSNAYQPESMAAGGQWHGVDYDKQIVRASFDHLAAVPDPRYENSIILTPEEFQKYNADNEQKLMKLANAKGDTSMKFNLWKKTKVDKIENALDVEDMSVTLPKSQKEITLSALIQNADEQAMTGAYACADHMVKVNGGEMSVSKLADAYNSMKKNADDADAAKKKADDEAAAKKKNDEDDAAKKKNADDEAAKKDAEGKKENGESQAEKDEKLKNAREVFEKLQNAHNQGDKETVLNLTSDGVARGKARYGSGN